MKDHTEDPDDKTEPIEFTQWSPPHREVLDMGLWDGPTLEALAKQAPANVPTLVGMGPEPRKAQEKPGVQARPAEPMKPKDGEAKAVPRVPARSTVKRGAWSIVKDKQRLLAFAAIAVLAIGIWVYQAVAKPKGNEHVKPVESVAVSVAPGAPSAMSPPDAVTEVPPAASASATVGDAARVHPPVVPAPAATGKQAAPAKPLVHKKPMVAVAPPAVTAETQEVAPEKVEPETTAKPAAKYHNALEE